MGRGARARASPRTFRLRRRKPRRGSRCILTKPYSAPRGAPGCASRTRSTSLLSACARVSTAGPLLFIVNVRRHDAIHARELEPIQPPVELRDARAAVARHWSSGSSAKPAASTATAGPMSSSSVARSSATSTAATLEPSSVPASSMVTSTVVFFGRRRRLHGSAFRAAERSGRL